MWPSTTAPGPSGGTCRTPRLRPESLPLRAVAVAQTPGGLTGAVLRVGSKKPKVVARLWRALPGLDALGPVSGRHSERGPGFRRRLCATATATGGRRRELPAHPRLEPGRAQSAHVGRDVQESVRTPTSPNASDSPQKQASGARPTV